MSREEIFEYVKSQYGTMPEYFWRSDPSSAVFRHPNGKWYGIMMNIRKSALGLKDDMMVDVINVKCEPDMTYLLTQIYGFFPGYHVNKKILGYAIVGRNGK